jgi:ComF family protein
MELWQRIGCELRQCCEMLLPPACLLCGERLPAGMTAIDLCPVCRSGLQLLTPGRCPVCAVAYRAPEPALHHCEDCLRQPPPFSRVHAVGPYAGTLQDAVQRFKYRGQLALERPLGALLTEAVSRESSEHLTLVVPVPLHVTRLRERGYNQSLQLARQVGRRLDVPVAADLLRRTRPTSSQQGLAAAARKRNLRGAFAVSAPLAGGNILLVDDVLTTGTTARECATALRAAGATAVEVAVIGRA